MHKESGKRDIVFYTLAIMRMTKNYNENRQELNEQAILVMQ